MSQFVFGIFGVIFGACGLVLSIILAVRNKKIDNTSEGKQGGIMLTEIGYIKAGIDDVKRDTREFRAEIQSLHDRVVRNEESCKQAHKRIDTLAKYHQPN
jgi:hypothetical protein